ncbi:hypothetical protein ZWY2020_039645 [Hordeum vulgare]|nr:hypothetical protein ZWY2020_039645 [Hordeum vulgare]
MADDPASARSSSSAADEDEGTDSDASNNSHPPAALEAPLPDCPAPPPSAPAADAAATVFPEPAGPVSPPPPQGAVRHGPFYEEIRRKLSFDFSKNQLIEAAPPQKKYRVCATRMASQGAAFAFKSAHEAPSTTSRAIWRPPSSATAPGATPRTRTTSTPQKQQQLQQPPLLPPLSRLLRSRKVAAEARLRTPPGAGEPAVAAFESSVPVIAQPPSVPAAPLPPYPVTTNGPSEAHVRSILSPLLKELISSVAVPGQNVPGLGLGMGFGGADILGAGLGVAGLSPRVPGDDKWRQQQVLELEVYLKRIELVREQVMAALQQLRSSQS